MLDASVDHEATDEQLGHGLACVYRMPQAYRILARELLRSLINHPEATRIVGRILVDFAKKNQKLTIVGGALGSNVLDVSGVEDLAKSPSLDELRATLVGLLQAPATKLAGVAQAPAGQLARVFSAYGSQGEAA